MFAPHSRMTSGRLHRLLPTALTATMAVVALVALAAVIAVGLAGGPAPALRPGGARAAAQTKGFLADLDRAQQRILIVAPHPDDEALGVGGLAREFLLGGSEVWVAFATNGDANVGSAQIWFNTSSPSPSQWVEYGEVRQQEARTAAAEIGVPVENIVFLAYPDSGVDDLWESNWSAESPWTSPYTKQDHSPYRVSLTPASPYAGEATLRDFIRVLETVKPTLLFVPHPADTHQDHWATGAFAVAAFEALRASGSEAAWTDRTRVFEYLIHWNKWPWPSGLGIGLRFTSPPGLESFSRWESVDVRQENRYSKSRAIAEYRSQGLTNDAFTYLLSFSRANELFATSEPLVIPAPGSSLVIANPNSGWHRPGTPTAISITRTHAAELSVGIQLDRVPTSRQSWLLRFYGITPRSAQAGNLAILDIQAWPDGRIDLRTRGMGTAASSADVRVAVEQSSLRVTLPLALVPGSTFLFSVETLDGGSSVNKTPYQTIRM